MRCVVIGSGFGGLAAAIRLQASGHQVTIVEKLDKAGGRAYVFQQDGFTFDAGPTIITAPWVFDELFTVSGKRREDYVQFVPLDPFYNIRFEDGTVFHYNGDDENQISQVRAFSNGRDVDGYRRLLNSTRPIYDVGMALLDKPFLTLWSFLKVIPDLVRLRADRSVAAHVNRFLTDDRLRRAFSFHPLLVGGNPFNTSSVYTLIHRLEREWGVLFCMGGTGALVRGLLQLFEDIGGKVRLSSEVAEIEVDRATKTTTGVRLVSGERIAADLVVCNGDVAEAYRRLVPAWARPSTTDARIKRYTYSMSLFVIYFGTDKVYPDTAHHEIILGKGYKELLEDVFDKKILSDDFSLYLHRPTATDPSLAYRTWAAASIGKSWGSATAIGSCSISRIATCRGCSRTSSPSVASIRATSSRRSTATMAARSARSRRLCSRRTCGRTIAARISPTCTSAVPARTRGRGCLA